MRSPPPVASSSSRPEEYLRGPSSVVYERGQRSSPPIQQPSYMYKSVGNEYDYYVSDMNRTWPRCDDSGGDRRGYGRAPVSDHFRPFTTGITTSSQHVTVMSEMIDAERELRRS